MKAIIIGAGGAGLAALHGMNQAGADAVAFEQHAELGGVWATTQYPSLTIHSKSFNYRFHDFPAVASRGPSATRDEILAYFAAFARTKGIAEKIAYGRRVQRIVYRPARATERCLVIVTDVHTGAKSEHPCDVVVCATGFSNAGCPHVPDLAGRATSKVRVLHSSEFSATILDDIKSNHRKVVVLGAGKSAHEILWLLHDSDPTWVYTKSLWSLSHEALYPASGIPWNVVGYLYYLQLAKLRRRIGFGPIMKALQAPLRWSGLFVNPLEPASDICINRAAIMKREQLAFLETVRSVRAAVIGVGDRTVRLANAELEADYLICATGYDRRAWVPEVEIEAADGTTTPHSLTDQHGFYHQMIDPAVPGISVLSANVLYPQQLLGYSLGAQWLARFHTRRLTRHPSPPEIARSVAADAARFSAWCSGDYLSGGLPYAHDRNEDVLPHLFEQMGLPRSLARSLVLSGANEAKFSRLCDEVATSLTAS